MSTFPEETRVYVYYVNVNYKTSFCGKHIGSVTLFSTIYV